MATSCTFSCEMTCSIHVNQVALAVCFNTKELLCFQCCMDKAKSSEKNTVQEIEKITEDSEKLLLNCILAKQNATIKLNLINEYEEKTKVIKENISQQVREVYDQLLKKLDELRDSTFTLIENKYRMFLKPCQIDKEELETLYKTITEHIDKLPTGNECGDDSLKSETERIMNILDDIDVTGYESSPEGSFVAKTDLKKAIDKCTDSLGEVNILIGDHYEDPDSLQSQIDDDIAESDEDVSVEQPPKIPPKQTNISKNSDDNCNEKPKILPRKKKTKGIVTGSEEIPTEISTSQNKQDSAMSAKRDGHDSLIVGKHRKWFHFGKHKTQENLEVYVDANFIKDDFTKARYLINTTKSLSDLPSQFKTPFKFTKLIRVGPRRVGLLSKENSSIFVARLDGKVQYSKTYEKDQLESIVGMTDDTLAVLKNHETEIEIIEERNGKFELKDTINLTLDISNSTGFDYSRTKSQFAIGTDNQYVLVDKRGKSVKVKKMEASLTSLDMITIFDFEKSNIFIINKVKKSMKCVVFKDEATLWKRKVDHPSFQPVAAYLHQQKLCIASPRVITVLGANNGEPERNYEADDLVKDCLGLCVIDDEVLVISSNSDDFEESKKLGFVGF